MKQTERLGRIKWIAMVVIAMAIVQNCANNTAPVVPHIYGVALDYHGIGPIGGILFEVVDPDRVVDSSSIVWKGYESGYQVNQARWSATKGAWRFIMLAKHRSLSWGDMVEFTATRVLSSTPRIVEACDDKGLPLPLSDFEFTLDERL